MMHDKDHVVIHGAFVVWDGITRPGKNDKGDTYYNLKVVIDPNSPDLQDIKNLGDNTLRESEFKGVLPRDGRMPVGLVQPNEFNGLYPGWSIINCTTYKIPDVFDEHGALLNPAQYGTVMYTGQKVDVVVSCKAYNNVGRGVGTRLDGFRIIASANAPRQNFGSGGIDASKVFGQREQFRQEHPQLAEGEHRTQYQKEQFPAPAAQQPAVTGAVSASASSPQLYHPPAQQLREQQYRALYPQQPQPAQQQPAQQQQQQPAQQQQNYLDRDIPF